MTPTLEAKEVGRGHDQVQAAYLRSLNCAWRFGRRMTYARHIGGGATDADYAAIRLHLSPHAAEADWPARPHHTGFGRRVASSANPLLLEPVLDDASLRKTQFVLLHGGAGPYTTAVASLLMKPNVYADFSEQTWLLPKPELAKSIRYMLEYYPEKVMFGTDLSPGTPQIDWEEIGWQTTNAGREALAIALTGMIQDGEITRPRALEIARRARHGVARLA